MKFSNFSAFTQVVMYLMLSLVGVTNIAIAQFQEGWDSPCQQSRFTVKFGPFSSPENVEIDIPVGDLRNQCVKALRYREPFPNGCILNVLYVACSYDLRRYPASFRYYGPQPIIYDRNFRIRFVLSNMTISH